MRKSIATLATALAAVVALVACSSNTNSSSTTSSAPATSLMSSAATPSAATSSSDTPESSAASSADSGSGTAASGTGGGSMTTISVAVSPGAGTSTPMYLGVSKGFFSKRGLDVKLSVLANGSVAIPQVLNGQLQFSMASFGPVLQAAAKGLEIQMLGAANITPTTESTYQAYIVKKDSTITSFAGVTSLATQSSVRNPGDNYAINKLGGDYDKIKLLQVPLGSIADTVASGAAQTGWLFQPFLDQALATGKVKVLSYIGLDESLPGTPGAVFIASDKYLAANPAVAADFIAGFEEAYTYAQSHRDEVSAYTTQTGLTKTALPADQLGEYPVGAIPTSKVQEEIDLFSQLGYVESAPTAEKLMYTPSS